MIIVLSTYTTNTSTIVHIWVYWIVLFAVPKDCMRVSFVVWAWKGGLVFAL